MTVLFAALIAGLLMAKQSAAPVVPPQPETLVIAYYSGNATEIDKYEIEKLTHIIYSFVLLRGNRLHVSAAAGTILKKLVSLKKRNRSLKVQIAFGGWGGCKTCPLVFSSDKGRNEFAGSVKEVLTKYELDGIDIDWEYPAVQGPVGHPFSPADKEIFTKMIQALRSTLGNEKEISFAAGGFSEFLEKSIEWKKVASLADRIHLMSYDLVNRNSVVTGHHTPIYSTAIQKESADNAIRFFDSLGIPRKKIVIGAACYARVYAKVPPANNGLYQPCSFERFFSFKNYPQLFSAGSGFNNYWDDEAKAPWSYHAGKKLFATYDNKRSVQLKTQYAIDKKLAGIMFWELRQDLVRNGLLHTIYEVKTRGKSQEPNNKNQISTNSKIPNWIKHLGF
jgi:chitinase